MLGSISSSYGRFDKLKYMYVESNIMQDRSDMIIALEESEFGSPAAYNFTVTTRSAKIVEVSEREGCVHLPDNSGILPQVAGW